MIYRLVVAFLAAVLVLGCGAEEQSSPGDRDRPRAERATKKRTGDDKAAKQRDRQARDRADRGSRASGIPAGARRTTVVRVVDGDTVELRGLGSSRLIGVDTPEVHGGVECFGQEASAFTKSHLALGTTVDYVRGTERTDRYGRPLVYLWLPGGTFFNAALVAEGYAMPLTIPPNVEYAERFRRLARAARAADRGLWSPRACGGDPTAESAAGAAGSRRGGAGARGGGCEPGYSPCVPTYPPDVDCADVRGPVRVTGSDPHGLDGDRDGVGCE